MPKKPTTPPPTIDNETGEVMDTSMSDPSGNVLTVKPELMSEFVDVSDDSRAKIVRRITIPVLPMDVDSERAIAENRLEMTIAVKVVEAIHEGRALANAKYPTPAKLMTVESVNGTQAKIVVSAVLQKELAAAYNGDEYVGRWFRLTKFRRKHQKQYNTFEVIETERPEKVTRLDAPPYVAKLEDRTVKAA